MLDLPMKHGETINLAGRHIFNYYQFWELACEVLELDRKLVRPRKYKIEASPRPFRGGLDVGKALRLGIPIYTAREGLEAMV